VIVFLFFFSLRPRGKLPHQVRLDDLDPVPVRVLNEGQISHRPFLWPLDEFHVALVKVSHGGLEVWYRNSDVAEALGVLVAVVVRFALFELGSWKEKKRNEEDRRGKGAVSECFFMFSLSRNLRIASP
jgi:hypothetical protein